MESCLYIEDNKLDFKMVKRNYSLLMNTTRNKKTNMIKANEHRIRAIFSSSLHVINWKLSDHFIRKNCMLCC